MDETEGAAGSLEEALAQSVSRGEGQGAQLSGKQTWALEVFFYFFINKK